MDYVILANHASSMMTWGNKLHLRVIWSHVQFAVCTFLEVLVYRSFCYCHLQSDKQQLSLHDFAKATSNKRFKAFTMCKILSAVQPAGFVRSHQRHCCWKWRRKSEEESWTIRHRYAFQIYTPMGMTRLWWPSSTLQIIAIETENLLGRDGSKLIAIRRCYAPPAYSKRRL